MIEMKKDFTYRFPINVSFDCYNTKEIASHCLSSSEAKLYGKSQMCFKVRDVNTQEFLNIASNGFTFCNLFAYDKTQKYYFFNSKTKKEFPLSPEYEKGANAGYMRIEMKRCKFFAGSFVIFVDIDDTKYLSAIDFIQKLKYTPTIAYNSYSNGIAKNGVVCPRFHMVYVFDTILGEDQFKETAKNLTWMVENCTGEPLKDKCGEKIDQYFNGCFGDTLQFNSGIIYSPGDIEERVKTEEEIEEEKVETPIVGVVNERLVDQMRYYSKDDFMHFWSKIYKYFYRPEKYTNDANGDPVFDGPYQYIGPEYFRLSYIPVKIMDGHNRRKKAFERQCLRVLMCRLNGIDLDINTLIFNGYVDRYRFFEIDDDFDIDCIVRNAVNAMSKSNEWIENTFKDHIQALRARRPRGGIIYNLDTFKGMMVGKVNEEQKRIRYEILDDLFDPELSVEDNLNIIKTKFPISQSSLYNYCNERGILQFIKQNRNSLIIGCYNPDETISENLDYMRTVPGLQDIKQWEVEAVSARWNDDRIERIKKYISFNKDKKVSEIERGLKKDLGESVDRRTITKYLKEGI